MHIHYLSEQNSLLNHFLAEIRAVSIQNDRMRFRKNMERIGEIMAYELSKTLDYRAIAIQTPLGTGGFVLDFACGISVTSRVYEFF